ncbi:MAG TPA: hypothetical protein VHS96_14170 [Bacteroidia bacterium]|nr:hypothetical protein [Bacteroidia bacterium]
MKNRHLLTSYWFLAGLFLLLVNDLVLKAHFGNWLTGKLSDFAGLFIFPLLFTAIFPKQKRTIFALTAILFSLWKSALSQPFIDAWNANGWLTIGRVVDPSDLLGLLALPLAFVVESRGDKLKLLRIPPALPFLLATFAFAATTYYTEVPIGLSHTFQLPKDSLLQRWNNLEAYHEGKDRDLSFADKDTVELLVHYDFCFSGFRLNAVITETGNKSTTIEIMEAIYSCPEENTDRKIILSALYEISKALEENARRE